MIVGKGLTVTVAEPGVMLSHSGLPVSTHFTVYVFAVFTVMACVTAPVDHRYVNPVPQEEAVRVVVSPSQISTSPVMVGLGAKQGIVQFCVTVAVFSHPFASVTVTVAIVPAFIPDTVLPETVPAVEVIVAPAGMVNVTE